jgi:hypothetical protein
LRQLPELSLDDCGRHDGRSVVRTLQRINSDESGPAMHIILRHFMVRHNRTLSRPPLHANYMRTGCFLI